MKKVPGTLPFRMSTPTELPNRFRKIVVSSPGASLEVKV